MKNIGVLGLGNFGFALLRYLDGKHDKNYRLSGYAREAQFIDSLRSVKKHPYFPEASPLSDDVIVYDELEAFLKDLDVIILSISSNALTEVLKKIKYFITKPVIFVNTSKALDHTDGDIFSKVVSDIYYDQKCSYAMLAGATMAKDIIEGVPLGINIACEHEKPLSELIEIFDSKTLRVFPTQDVAGVEYAAAFKNVISVFSGILNGMGYGKETEIYSVTQAALDVERFAVKEKGAKLETFALSSPCWGNDLWMSCTSNTRNREFGKRIGKGMPVQELLLELELQKQTVEGVFTIQAMENIMDLPHYKWLNFIHLLFSGKTTLSSLEKLF